MPTHSKHPKYESISEDFEHLRKSINTLSFDVIVVGSGYGGSISASRMARIGKRVCLLERGREILPGDYPATLSSAQKELHIRTDTQPDKSIGNSNGLYDMRVNEDVSVLVGCGLGGTSLINANVSLETDPAIFSNKDRPWPKEFLNGTHELERFYKIARDWLGAQPYPGYKDDVEQTTRDTYPRLNKLDALAKSAETFGVEISIPPINVNFEDKIDNGHGLAQPRCNLCGDCCTGCNHGSKNTTLMNYLPDAHNHDASIYCNCSVDYIERQPKEKTWSVSVYNSADETKKVTIKAKTVILAAGTLGSTQIMLRSKANGLSCSDTLGHGFSGNGDVLAFGYNSYWKDNDETTDGGFQEDDKARYESVYAVGRGENKLTDEQLPGPCITGCIDLRDPKQPVSTHRVLEEGVIPGALSRILPTGFFFAAAQKAHFLKYGKDQATDRLKEIQQLGAAVSEGTDNLSELCYHGAISRTQTYLLMSVDSATGRLELKNNHVVVDWPGAGSSRLIKNDNDTIAKACDAVHGQFLPFPIWDKTFGNKILSVHPLGGCCMADSAENGTVNHACQVFSGNKGSELHEGLYICDGSVIPGAVGVNPLLTISAITERACELINGKPIDVGYLEPQLGDPEKTVNLVTTEAPKLDVPLPILAQEPGPEQFPTNGDKFDSNMLLNLLEAWLKRYILEKCGKELEEVKQDILAVVSAGAITFLAEEVRIKRKNKQLEAPAETETQLWNLQAKTVSDLLTIYGEQFSQRLSFTETMHGYVDSHYCDPQHSSKSRLINKFALAYQVGKAAGDRNAMSMTVTIETDDLYQLIINRSYSCRITGGSIHCPALFKKPAAIKSGCFTMLQRDTDQVESWLMEYKVHLEHNPAYLYGRKILHCTPGSHWWTDLSQLEISVYNNEKDAANTSPRAIGLITLSLQDFLHQINSVKENTKDKCVSGIIDILCKITKQDAKRIQHIIAQYYVFKLAGALGLIVFKAYGGLLSNLKNFPAEERLDPAGIHFSRPLNAPQATSIPVVNGEKFKLTRYQGEGIPVILVPGMGVNASSFATPTVSENIVEYLTLGSSKANRDVWLLDYRASFDSGHSTEPFTIDDIAREDWPKAIDRILEITKKQNPAQQVQIVAHCVGSLSLLMALLAGHVDPKKIRSIVSSQLTLHPVTNWLNNAKADSDLIAWLKTLALIEKRNFTLTMNSAKTRFDHEFDVMTYQAPVPEGEQCNNPTCRRIFSLYGPSYLHRHLNHQTHIAMSSWFKDIHIKPFEHLSKIIQKGYVVDAEGKNTYLTDEIVHSSAEGNQIPRLDLPIAFIAAALNLEFLPETSERTYAWLCAHNPLRKSDYHRHVIEGYGHMDCFIGKNASIDVFPIIHDYLESQRIKKVP